MLKSIKKISLLLIILNFSSNTFSEYLKEMKLLKVIDGDTIHSEYKGNLYKIRLLEIDAPETDQPHGLDSKNYLKKLLNGGTVDTYISGKDRYGRYLARLYLKSNDINKKMVETGNAWVYERYSSDESFYNLQISAKEKRLGLWSADNPVKPWEWRKLRKKK